MAGGVAQGDDQRFHRRLGDIRHAAPQLDQALVRPAAHQLQHLLPLRNVYRPLHRRHGRQLGLRALRMHEVARLRPRFHQALFLQQPVGLLYRTDADAVLLAQCAHRRQAVAGRIQPLLNTLAENGGQGGVACHTEASYRDE